VGHPAAVFLVVVIVVRRRAAPAPIPEIIVISVGEPELLVQVITARHDRLLLV
jgi:hypothetical protein